MLCIIQARSNSKRFKNKVLHLIYGLPLIAHVINRVIKSKEITKLVVSSSMKKSDDNLISYLKTNNIEVFRGHLNNVAKRLYKTAEKYNSKFFIRINGDSPLIDYKLINKAIKISKKYNKYDIITNVYPRTFPQGQSVEIIKVIKKNLKNFSKLDKEHVTKYFYDNSNKFIKLLFNGKKNNFKQSIDTKQDLKDILRRLNKKFNNYTLK